MPFSSPSNRTKRTRQSDCEEDEIRPARPAFRETLIGPSDYPHRHRPITEQTSSSFGPNSINEGDRAFSNLFAIPKPLINHSSFEETLRQAKDQQKWVIINIQKNDNFESHRLNRDVWRGESVQEVIRGSFLFWQRQSDHPEAKIFCGLYKITVFPSLCVIDPRTGRLAKKWELKKFSDEFAAVSEIIDFLESREGQALKPAFSDIVKSSTSRHSADVEVIDSDSELELEAFDVEDDDGNTSNIKNNNTINSSQNKMMESSLSNSDVNRVCLIKGRSSNVAENSGTALCGVSRQLPCERHNSRSYSPLVTTLSESNLDSTASEQHNDASQIVAYYKKTNVLLKQLFEERIKRGGNDK